MQISDIYKYRKKLNEKQKLVESLTFQQIADQMINETTGKTGLSRCTAYKHYKNAFEIITRSKK
jgi:hypothetical protein